MIVFDDTSCERETESPSSFLACESRLEDLLVRRALHAFTGVSHVDVDVLGVFRYLHRQFSFVFHGIESVFGEVLEHPTEERDVQRNYYLSVWNLDVELELIIGETSFQVVHSVVDCCHHIVIFQCRDRTNLRETFRYGLHPVDVFLHLRRADERSVLHLKQLYPSHERRERRSYLMRSLLRHTSPHLILLRTTSITEQKIRHNDEEGEDKNLHYREITDYTEQIGTAVIDICLLAIEVVDFNRHILRLHNINLFLNVIAVAHQIRLKVAITEDLVAALI